jgi:hypothetical protein
MAKQWTGGPGTDIRLKDPACKSWEARVDKIDIVTTWTRR